MSNVEQIALKKSGCRLKYEPVEKICCITVDNFPALGKLTAMRFLEWVQNNPEGVISLPTGKSPEFFIKEAQRLINNWEKKDIQDELSQYGVDPSRKPVLKNLHFVQIDEFYPIAPHQHNSFFHYVNEFYIKGFGLDANKAMLMNCMKIGIPKGKTLDEIWPAQRVDLGLRYRPGHGEQERLQKVVLENVDQWCAEYEQRVRALGGIGFFLGGIGPDGHIGFNVRGSDVNSTTRLTSTNYETQAAAASDLGGVEISRNRLVITIGLATITYNPNCVGIIIAAGEAKAKIVADAVQQPKHIHYPATVLQDLSKARFYLTRGAAKLLSERQLQTLKTNTVIGEEEIERIVIDLALEKKKSILSLTRMDFRHDPFASHLLRTATNDVEGLVAKLKDRIERKVIAGTTIATDKVFLHTEPHHDDIMLGYLPYVVRNIREHRNQHHFVTLTSGFTAVTNQYMRNLLIKLRTRMKHRTFAKLLQEGYFEPNNTFAKNRDVWRYLDGVAANSEAIKDDGQVRRLCRNMICLWEARESRILLEKIDELIHYFESRYPGQKDVERVQQLKGMLREFESDCLWGYFGWHSDAVHHLRLGFYKGDIFTEEPTLERDVMPILTLLRQVNPDVVTVALDPEASGPDTHYKVLQAITEALKIYEKESNRSDIEILGYRNVWYRFHPSEADIFVPVSLNMFSLQDSSFKNSYLSQKDASFPSHEHNGPFSELAQKIQVEQYQMLKTCLGREFFYEHSSALIRATRGMVFLKRMTLQEFYQRSRELRRSTENL